MGDFLEKKLGINLIQICSTVAQLLPSLFTLCNQGNHRNHLKIFAICHFLSSCLWLMLVFLVIWLDWQVTFNPKVPRKKLRYWDYCIGFVLMTPAIILSLLEILKKTNLTAIIIQVGIDDSSISWGKEVNWFKRISD